MNKILAVVVSWLFAVTIVGALVPNRVFLPMVRTAPAPTVAPIPTATLTPEATATLQPTATPTQIPSGPCSCSGDLYNCKDFDTHSAAQACFDYCKAVTGRDVHNLDSDGDGRACESLPRVREWVP